MWKKRFLNQATRHFFQYLDGFGVMSVRILGGVEKELQLLHSNIFFLGAILGMMII